MPFSYTVQNGETANSIAQKFGFKNYKEAGLSGYSSGNPDLIRAGETLTLSNYDPNTVKTFGSTPPVISSVDNKNQFIQDSNKISSIDKAFSGIYGGANTKTTTDTSKTTTANNNGTTTTTDTTVESTGDPVYDNILKQNKEQEAKLEAEKAQKKADYQALFNTSLANLDATTQATLDRINNSYDKRIKEQERINRLNIDRTKAYGLANGGQYTPIDFGDAVSAREQEASDKITSLEGERTDLINQAKVARDNGMSALLRQKLQDLDKIDVDIRTQLKNVEDESDKRYKMLRDIRTAEETKAKERRDKAIAQIASLAPMYSDQYEKMSPEDKNKFIQQIVTQTGLDFATIYGTIEAGVMKGAKDKLDLEGKKLDISKKNVDVATAWKKLNNPTGDNKNAQMSKDAPATFESAADFNKKKTDFVRKWGTAGANYWDDLYQKDNVGDYTYTIEKKTTTTPKTGTTKTTTSTTKVSTPSLEDLRKQYNY